MKKHGSIMCLLLIAAAGVAKAQQLHPKLKSKEVAPRSVLILPAKVEISKQGIKGGEGMLKESEAVSAKVREMVSRMLADKGLKTVDGGAGTAEPEQYSVSDLQSRYDALALNLNRKPKDVAKGRFTLGDEVATINPDGAVDALVFIRGSGFTLTGGKIAFGFLVAGPKRSTLTLTISMVDARTGDVLYLAQAMAMGNFVGETEKTLAKPLAKSLKKISPAQ